jgi:hypothetical protein
MESAPYAPCSVRAYKPMKVLEAKNFFTGEDNDDLATARFRQISTDRFRLFELGETLADNLTN